MYLNVGGHGSNEKSRPLLAKTTARQPYTISFCNSSSKTNFCVGPISYCHLPPPPYRGRSGTVSKSTTKQFHSTRSVSTPADRSSIWLWKMTNPSGRSISKKPSRLTSRRTLPASDPDPIRTPVFSANAMPRWTRSR